jgi:integrase
MKVSEILNLTRADVEGGFVSVRRLKGSEPTIQPLMEHTNPLFNEKAAVSVYVRNLALEQRLFPFTRFQADRKFKKYGAAAALPEHKRHCHVLKHTSLAKMIGPAGVPATQAWAGHKSGASTLMYTKVDPDEAARAARSALSTGI